MVSSRHSRPLAAIFERPVRADIRWAEIETLFRALGAEIEQGAGSRVRVTLNGIHNVFHRPHPRPETDKGAVKAVRKFLIDAGIRP